MLDELLEENADICSVHACDIMVKHINKELYEEEKYGIHISVGLFRLGGLNSLYGIITNNKVIVYFGYYRGKSFNYNVHNIDYDDKIYDSLYACVSKIASMNMTPGIKVDQMMISSLLSTPIKSARKR